MLNSWSPDMGSDQPHAFPSCIVRKSHWKLRRSASGPRSLGWNLQEDRR